jgi:epoxide hydrolase
MNADLRSHTTEIEAFRLALPEAALTRLRLRLSQGLANGEVLDACFAYGAPCGLLWELVEQLALGFELEPQPLFDLPLFEAKLDGERLSFVHARSSERGAMPLLLLHGFTASLAEFQSLIEPLTTPPRASTAFHVVCPSLPGFGFSSGVPSPRAAAQNCAALMQRLGYRRYVVHGSDLGANIALELAALDQAHVAGLHVTALCTYPDAVAETLAELTSQEKSRLGRLTELHDEICFQLPRSPIEELAFALSRFDDAEQVSRDRALRETLLTGLTLAWTLGDSEARVQMYRHRLDAAPTSSVPVAVESFPLDAPNLRRFAEARHRVVQWCEHERGGPMPALEQPTLLLESLRSFFAQLR